MKATAEIEAKEPLEEMTKSKPKTKAEQAPPTGLRLPDELKEAVEERAQEEGVSFGEMCRRFLQDGLTKNPEHERATLLKSLAITEAQLKRAVERKTIRGAERLLAGIAQAQKIVAAGEDDFESADAELL